MKIMFDMDGTFVDLYGVKDWLPKLRAEDASPYLDAKPLFRMSDFARIIHKLQAHGIEVGVISWTSMGGSLEYHDAVVEAKLEWLHVHLPSVEFDEIHIVEYGTPKHLFGSDADILFDDDVRNRDAWNGLTFDEKDLVARLKAFL